MNRRELFMLAGVALLAACGGKGAPLPLAPRAHLDDAKHIGRLWLDGGGYPHEISEISADLLQGFAGSDPTRFTTHLLTRHQADLLQGRSTRVQGWLLSRTEALLYAWLALG
jgi:hypothetical protein